MKDLPEFDRKLKPTDKTFFLEIPDCFKE